VLRTLAAGYLELRDSGIHHQAQSLAAQHGVEPVAMPRICVCLHLLEDAQIDQHIRSVAANRRTAEFRRMAEDFHAFQSNELSKAKTVGQLAIGSRSPPVDTSVVPPAAVVPTLSTDLALVERRDARLTSAVKGMPGLIK